MGKTYKKRTIKFILHKKSQYKKKFSVFKYLFGVRYCKYD